jgi:hypothetical protein
MKQIKRLEAQRRNSLKSPWRNGPHSDTKRAHALWRQIVIRREKELAEG